MGNEKCVHSLLPAGPPKAMPLWLTRSQQSGHYHIRSSFISRGRALKQLVSLQELHQDIFYPGLTHGLDFVNQPYSFLLDLEKTC
jgi:hypothetical protein